MRIFGRAAERGRGWVSEMRETFSAGGTPEMGPNMEMGQASINGMPLYVPQIWGYYDAVGEFHFDARFMALCLSRCTLRLGVLDVDNKVGPAFDEDSNVLEGVPVRLAKLGARMIAGLRSAPGQSGPAGGHGMLLSRMGANLFSVAICFLVASETPMGTHWEVLSTMELQPATTPEGEKQRFRRRRHRGTPWEDFTPTFYLPIYDPHPAWSGDPDSGALSLATVLERISLLNDEGLADSKSRLTRGVYWISTDADFPGTDEDPDGANYMSRELIKVATQAIRDPQSAARQVPLVARASTDVIDRGTKFERFEYDSSELIEKRASAVGDLARGAPLPYEMTMGMSESSFCVDDETEILTAEGWQKRTTLCLGELVLTLNHETGASEWQPLDAVNTFDLVDEPMLLIQGKAHNSMTTAGHRWPVVECRGQLRRHWETSATLGAEDRIVTAAPNAELPRDPKWSDELVELIGWFFTEGSIKRGADGNGPPLGVIHQSVTANHDRVLRIRLLLTRLAGPPSDKLGGTAVRQKRAWREDWVDKGKGVMAVFSLSRPLTEDLEELAPDRCPTLEFVYSLTAGQLELFIDAAMAGDGWRTNMGSRVIAQIDSSKLDALEMACILTGRTPYRWTEPAARYSYEPRKGDGDTYERHYLVLSDRTGTLPFVAARQKTKYATTTIKWVPHTGTVWCPTTANGTWMARRAGKVFFTGNSNAFAAEGQLARIFVPPVLDTITGCLTAGWFIKGLMQATGQPFDRPPSEDVQRLVVWYDISELVTDPDPTKVAQWAYGTDTNPNNIINAKGVRRLLGIPEGERPTAEETSERLARAKELRARSEQGNNNPDTSPDEPNAPPDGERDTDEEVGKRVMSLANMAVSMAVQTVGSKLRVKCAKKPEYLRRIDGVDAADVARVLGPATVEVLGGTGPLFNGSFHAFGHTVMREFSDIGRVDAADLAAAAVKMVERASLARLGNPAAVIDTHAAADFLALLNQ